MELAALQQLDTELAIGMRALVKPAIAAATGAKPDVKLLRLLTRYSSSAGRRLQSAHKPTQKSAQDEPPKRNPSTPRRPLIPGPPLTPDTVARRCHEKP